MISRRRFALRTLGAAIFGSRVSFAEFAEDAYQLTFPPIASLDKPQQFGYEPPTQAEREKAAEIVRGTPKGPRPIDIAQSFIDRFYTQDPRAISQWPAPERWNPLVVEFFSATSYRANNDMIPWCAALVNWCLERAQRTGSRQASSQSFLNNKAFKGTSNPAPGDLVVFTCFKPGNSTSVGLGHVGFVQAAPADGKVVVNWW